MANDTCLASQAMNEPAPISREAASVRLGVSVSSIDHLRAANEITSFKILGSVRIVPAPIGAYVERQTELAAQEREAKDVLRARPRTRRDPAAPYSFPIPVLDDLRASRAA